MKMFFRKLFYSNKHTWFVIYPNGEKTYLMRLNEAENLVEVFGGVVQYHD